MSLTNKRVILSEHLGIYSIVVKSLTNLILKFQSRSRLVTRNANRIGPNLVPWGIPPLRYLNEDISSRMRTHCFLLVKKARIHPTTMGCTFNFSNSASRTPWSTRSKPLLKSAKIVRAEEPPQSSFSKTLCSKKTNA